MNNQTNSRVKSPLGGVKADGGKPDLSLLLIPAMLEVGKVFDFGAKKYAAYNYTGLEANRLIAACLRHLMAHNIGEDNDPETGMPHLAHAACSAIMALQCHMQGQDGERFASAVREKIDEGLSQKEVEKLFSEWIEENRK